MCATPVHCEHHSSRHRHIRRPGGLVPPSAAGGRGLAQVLQHPPPCHVRGLDPGSVGGPQCTDDPDGAEVGLALGCKAAVGQVFPQEFQALLDILAEQAVVFPPRLSVAGIPGEAAQRQAADVIASVLGEPPQGFVHPWLVRVMPAFQQGMRHDRRRGTGARPRGAPGPFAVLFGEEVLRALLDRLEDVGIVGWGIGSSRGYDPREHRQADDSRPHGPVSLLLAPARDSPRRAFIIVDPVGQMSGKYTGGFHLVALRISPRVPRRHVDVGERGETEDVRGWVLLFSAWSLQ